MFGIGSSELVLILILALIFLGPKKLPGLARGIGRALAEFRRAGGEMRSQLGGISERAMEEVHRLSEAATREVHESQPSPPPPPTGESGPQGSPPDLPPNTEAKEEVVAPPTKG